MKENTINNLADGVSDKVKKKIQEKVDAFKQELQTRVHACDSIYSKSLLEAHMIRYIYAYTMHDKSLIESFVSKYIADADFRNRHFQEAQKLLRK